MIQHSCLHTQRLVERSSSTKMKMLVSMRENERELGIMDATFPEPSLIVAKKVLRLAVDG
jgi:hypothetical protein